jgi:hypothetical protein
MLPNRFTMRRSRQSFPVSVIVAFLLAAPAAAWAQAKVVVLDSVQASLNLKLGVRQAVATALDDLSVAMTPLEDLLPEDASCSDAACFAAIAKRVEGTHLLLVKGVANPAGYRLSIEVRDGESGRALGTDGKDCELCAEDQLPTTVQEKVTALWVRVMQEQAAAATPAAAAPTPVTVTEPRAATPWYQQSTPLAGAGFAAFGLLATGIGVYYIAQDGKATESSAVNGHAIIVRDTGKWGWTLAGVGLVSLAAGSAMMIWGQEDGANVAVAIGPRSVGLQGRF